METPRGNSRDEIKARERIIKDYYVKWIAQNPSKAVWNTSLKSFIKVKYISVNETIERAARHYDSTMAVLNLTQILKEAKVVSFDRAKHNDKNQKGFSRVIIMRWKSVRLIVGQQKGNGDYVQYCITVPSI